MRIMVIDTETANSVNQPLPYDIGYKIVDTDTRETLVNRSFVVQEIFMDKALMSSAYYAEKCPKYWDDLKAGTREMKRITSIKRIVAQDMQNTDCHTIAAYNMNFDKRATNNGIRYNTQSFYRWFFPYGVEYIDIWHMACSSILRSKWYIKWAIKNGYVSEAGNIKTSAEIAYRYITKNNDFIESHTGFEDVEIETAIYFKVLDSRMKYENSVMGSPWRIVQNKRKEFGL